MFNNSSGKRDGIWTLTVLTWGALMIQMLLGGSTFHWVLADGSLLDLKIPGLDMASATALMTTCLTDWGRRNGVGGKVDVESKGGLSESSPTIIVSPAISDPK